MHNKQHGIGCANNITYTQQYLGMVISCYNVFEGFPLRGNIHVKSEPIELLYPIFWKHNAPFQFFLIWDKFIKYFR
jgi:hypothetical protein